MGALRAILLACCVTSAAGYLAARGVASSRRAAPLARRAAPLARDGDASRRIKFSAKGKTVVAVDDVSAPADRPLDAYMALPAEQWIELDARLISRLPSTPTAAQRYAISVPLQIAAGVFVIASCTVDVDVDARARTLRLSGRNATLRVRSPDDTFTVNASTPAEQLIDPTTTDPIEEADNARTFALSLAEAELEVDFLTVARWRPAAEGRGRATAFAGGGLAQLLGGLGGRGAIDASGNGTLDIVAETTVAISLPSIAALAPGFLLEQGGAIVLRIITGALLPEFGKLVADDYRAWSRGLERTGGQLLRTLGGPGGEAPAAGAAPGAAARGADVAQSLDPGGAREPDAD